MSRDILAVAADRWDRKQSATSHLPTRWWQSNTINRHINDKLHGSPIPGLSAGFRRFLERAADGRRFQRAISVGCGSGQKERALLQMRLVEHFDLFEISGVRIGRGKDLYAQAGLSDRARFIHGDAFELTEPNSYDLVHWDGSLHHMLDVLAAMEWSRTVLKDDGWIAVNEFIGPTRFQWSDRELTWARRVREMLPPEFLTNCRSEIAPLLPIRRPTIEQMITMDPSEAADSSRIVEAAATLFPAGAWTMTGGAVYALALNDIIGNFERLPNGERWLQWCLAMDDLLSDLGENHYGAFIAPKIRS
jgi:SAM-dependent methyltransferase